MWTCLNGELESEVRSWTGNPAAIQRITRAEFDELVAKQDQIVMRWRRESTHLAGTPIIELMDHAFFD